MNIKKITEFINIENNKFVLIIILVGVCFMLFSGGGDNKEKEVINTALINVNEEERLEKILSQIKNVGSVSVMITYYSTAESDIAYESKQSSTEKEDGNDVRNRESNKDMQAVMSSGEPFVIRSIYPEAKGVIVAAEGAGIPKVKEEITNAVMTAIGIAAHRVCVVEK